ncbi:alpha/beta fold hydrolase [Companilactobacillus keshanensis]|uniref:Alpha/beta fold hydrolase n=1 Tax=Companilactobacillus keshanensis TaxID=2486003 RepID=A0ABW4BUA3_9LACO
MENKLETSRGFVNIKLTGDISNDKDIIVLVSGINGSISYYDTITPYLTDKYTVIAIDLLGQGNSGEGKDDLYTIDVEAWAIWEAIGRVKVLKPVIVFGYGVGGLIVNRMAEQHDIAMSKKIMLNTPATQKYADLDTSTTLSSIPLLGKMAKSSVKSNLYFAKNFDTSSLPDPNVIGDSAKDTDKKVAKKLLKSTDSYLEEMALNRRMRKANLPTLALFSDNDQILGEAGIKDAKATIGRVPNLKMEDVIGTGHIAFLEKPEEIAKKIIAFDESTQTEES